MNMSFRVAVVLTIVGLGMILWGASYSKPPAQPCAVGAKSDKCE